METLRITEDIAAAAEILQRGGLVAVPTETVYGLAGSGLDEKAVARIYEVKGRPAVKPLALMVPDGSAMDRYCRDVPAQARALAEKFWPGPLTIVLKAKEIIPSLVLAGGTTVGLRCPDHPLTLKLLRLCALPLAAPSANPSGAESPKTAAQVLDYFDGQIDAVIDGGPCDLGTASTILDMSAVPYRILRQGALPEEKIAEALSEELCVIGITGGTGCGKTTALRELESMGALVLDCDALYHELLRQGQDMLSELHEAFPEAFAGGHIDRKTLGRIVFGSPEKLALLNTITHKHVSRAVEERLRSFAMAGGSLAAIDAVELLSAGLGSRCDATIAVLADRDSRLRRIMARDRIGREEAEARIDAQKPDEYYIRSCSHILLNNADRESFLSDCRRLFKEIVTNGRS